MKLRKLSEQDIDSVYQLECAATAFPWSREQWSQSLHPNNLCTVAHHLNELIGCMVFSSVLDEATLLNIVVHPRFQDKGYGRQLLQQGLKALNRRNVTCCYLEVREGNDKAIALYQSLGFNQVGSRKNYYPAVKGREDALLMCWDLPQSRIGES